MVIPLLASGLLQGPLPAGASLFSWIPDVDGPRSGSFLSLSGPSESGERDPGFSGDDALLVQIALRDPAIRAAMLGEIDRRLSDDIPEDAETTARLAHLRDLLRRLDAAGPSGDSNPPRGPSLAAAPSGRVFFAVAKDVPEAAVVANEELVDRVLRASRLVRARGISRLNLTLETPELGEIRLHLTLRGKVVRATFQADVPGAAEIVRARLSELKSALEERGLQVGELTVLAAETGIPVLPPAPSTSAPGHLDLKA